MITSRVDLTATRGDTWSRLIPIEVQTGPNTRRRATAEELTALAARFTRIRLHVREEPGAPDPPLLALSSSTGALRIDPAAGGLAIEGPATQMRGFDGGEYDVELTEPRPGNPQGDRVWTLCTGRVQVTPDVSDGA
ncbi:hypothetical protein [Deinococcus budaensis]|uniref:Uncharacterized protein n=1 Tax=Deinococcus budaensis TaxID=1665626 RepID=A0A7W8GFQ3_9DEIO|nr:hypothetical protein [Deinococcus budaensis]MBB5234494.1 hypothetical protein [Deinococcus budaensis]